MQIIYSVNRVESIEISISNIPPVKFFVVLIGLVIIFQTNIKGVVSSVFSTIQTNAGKIR